MKQEIKNWWEKNKEKVYIAGGITVAFCGAYFLFKHRSTAEPVIKQTMHQVGKVMTDAEKECIKVRREIDKEIFTEVAPMLEDLILCPEGIDEYMFEKTYKVPHPKSEDFAKGLNEVSKRVTIRIEKV